jgi:cytochrome c
LQVHRFLHRVLSRSGAVVLALIASMAHAEDSDPGQAQFLKSCGVCHTVEKGAEIRQGPNLGDVFGRKAGTVAEFPTYSEALKKAGADGLVWTEDHLDKWMAGAPNYVPGSNMFYSQPDPDKRKLIIDYLKRIAAK